MRSGPPHGVGDIAWYHTIDLPNGEVTPGLFDHRKLVPRYGFPSTLSGMRALDVATFNGFWAFEMERRGAEVTAVDLDRASQLDLPQPAEEQRIHEGADAEVGIGFAFAKEALGSKVTRVVRSVYDIDPSDLGTFDFVHVADLLLHLRSPIAALTAIRSVCGADLLLSDCYDPGLSRRSGRNLVEYLGGWEDVVWWLPSLDTLAQMVADAGFRDVRVHTVYNLARRGEAEGYWRAVIRARV